MSTTVLVTIASGAFVPRGGNDDGVVYKRVAVDRNPDDRTEKWDDALGIVAKSAAEIAAYDYATPREIDGREIMRRLSVSTHFAIECLARTDATACKLWNTLKAGGVVNVHSAEFAQGAAYLKSVGIPSIWADDAAYLAEMAIVTA